MLYPYVKQSAFVYLFCIIPFSISGIIYACMVLYIYTFSNYISCVQIVCFQIKKKILLFCRRYHSQVVKPEIEIEHLMI
ncbi:hypothetical protein EZS27_034694 [termite gut metagenome]|uniref:Uncharacterized protein n=1 Tax=termite gut metagenome TaxID=433724 RepID=A0A5J4PYX2_9ZZZZ